MPFLAIYLCCRICLFLVFFIDHKGIMVLYRYRVKSGIVKDERYHIPFYPQWQQGNELIGICRYESAKKYFEENQIFVRSLDDEFEQEQPVLVFYTRQ